MVKEFDAIVVGAGPAGTIFSSKLAGEGFDVALLDRKPKGKIGKKVCGDGISKGYFKALDLPEPKGKELSRKVSAAAVHSPDTEGKIDRGGKGYTINRLPFGQRLLQRAERRGTHIFPETQAKNPIIENGAVKGVIARDLQEGDELKMEARVTMDATGTTAALRTRIPEKYLLETKIDKFDIDIAHRYIAKFPEEKWGWNEKAINVYLNQEVIPGGYGWVFPKERNIINVGVGIQALRKGIPPKKVTDTFLKEVLDIDPENLEILESGSGIVPVRRPLSMLVSDGFVLAGDVASNANPLHGGGIGHAMEAANLAAEEIAPKLEEKEKVLTKEDMWEYPRQYFQDQGSKNAALEIIRLALQGLNNDELNYIIKSELISGKQLSLLQSDLDQAMGVLRKISTGIRLAIFHHTLFNKLKKIRKLYKKAFDHFRNYPSKPSRIEKWHEKGEKIIQRAREDLWQDSYPKVY